MRKVLYLLAMILSGGVGIWAVVNQSLPNAFMPFAVFVVGTIMLTDFPGILKGAMSQGAIGVGALLTGVFIGKSPLFIPGMSYFLLSVSIPLGIISILDFLTFFSQKTAITKESEK